MLGAMQSLFEGSMYTFVFLWTPALSPDGEHLPHGEPSLTWSLTQRSGPSLWNTLSCRRLLEITD